MLNLALSPFFPRETNALYNDGAWFASWASWFGLGFLFARHHRALIEGLIARRWASAAIASVITLVLYRFSWTQGHDERDRLLREHDGALQAAHLLARLVYDPDPRRLRGAPSQPQERALTWLNHKIFPLYIVHQTVIVAALYYVLPLDLGVAAKVALVSCITLSVSLAFAIVADQLPWPLRTLVGLTGDPTGARDKVTGDRQLGFVKE